MINEFMIKSLFIPGIFKFYILKRVKIYVIALNKNKSIMWIVDSIFKIEGTIRCFSILSKNYRFYDKLNNFLKNCASLQVKLIKFKGKGYKLTKTQSIIQPLFSFSHIYNVLIQKNLVKKITKYKLAIINSDLKYLSKFCKNYIDMRGFDQYTTNGMRLKRQIIHRRRGKTIAS